MVGKVADLMIYPVVSCGALQVSIAQFSPDGLSAYGVRDKGLVVCKRNTYPHPMMAYGEYRPIPFQVHVDVGVEYTSNMFTLSISKVSPICFSAEHANDLTKERRVQLVCARSIYGGYKIDSQYGKWFKKGLKERDDIEVIHRSKLLWDKNDGRTALGTVIISNGESILETIVDSNDTIESKLKEAKKVLSPNIIISGCRPFTENRWTDVAIGRQLVCDVIGPDVRVVSQYHQEYYDLFNDWDVRDHGEATEIVPGGQFVCGMNSCQPMGLNVKVTTTGEISIGDPVYARYKPPATLREYMLDLYEAWKGLQAFLSRQTRNSSDPPSRQYSFLRSNRSTRKSTITTNKSAQSQNKYAIWGHY